MKNEKQHRLLFIIPAVIIAIILIIYIAVTVSSKSGEKGKKNDSRSVSVTENTQVIVAESEALELVKKDALKESNVVDKDNKQNDKQNNGTQPAANDNSAQADSNSDNANTASEKSSEKSSENKAAAGKKSSTGSDNAQQPEGELADLFAQKVKNEWGLEMCSAGVSEAYRCIYPSKNDIPDYKSALDESNGFYNFTGLYTKGEYDEYGYLICYMWEAGIF